MAPRPPNKDGSQKTNLPFRMAVDTRSRHAGHASSSRSTTAAAPPDGGTAMIAATASNSKDTYAATESVQPNQTSSDGRSLAMRAEIAPMYGRDGIDLADYVRDALVSPATPDGDNELARQLAENHAAIHELQNSPEQGGRYELSQTNTEAAMILARRSNNVLMSYMAVAPELTPEGVHDLARLHFEKKALQGEQSQQHAPVAERNGLIVVQPDQRIVQGLLDYGKKMRVTNEVQALKSWRLKEANEVQARENWRLKEANQEKDAQIQDQAAQIGLLNAEVAKMKSRSAEGDVSNEETEAVICERHLRAFEHHRNLLGIEASICKDHVRGRCRRGDNCKFVHLTDPAAFEHYRHLLDMEMEEKDAAAQKAAMDNKEAD